MRALTFNSQEGDFYLDQFENIGNFIEVAEIKSLRTKRVQGRNCYRFHVLLKFCCNISKSECVEFYTFSRPVRYLFIDLSESQDNWSLKSMRYIGHTNYKIKKGELVT